MYGPARGWWGSSAGLLTSYRMIPSDEIFSFLKKQCPDVKTYSMSILNRL
jgi:hypothetical protein